MTVINTVREKLWDKWQREFQPQRSTQSVITIDTDLSDRRQRCSLKQLHVYPERNGQIN